MPATAKLVTLAQAKAHLHITLPAGDPGDVELQSKVDEAEDTILRFLKGAGGAAAAWVDPVTAPGDVTAAIKQLLARLYYDRGEEDEDFEAFWTRIRLLTARWHSPGIA